MVFEGRTSPEVLSFKTFFTMKQTGVFLKFFLFLPFFLYFSEFRLKFRKNLSFLLLPPLAKNLKRGKIQYNILVSIFGGMR